MLLFHALKCLFVEQSRRDDLEALGHVLLYFLRGSLPWQGLKAGTNKQKYERIGEKKQSTGIRTLCEGYPSECYTYLGTNPYILNPSLLSFIDQFVKYMQYSRKLGYDEAPDYDWLRGLFTDVLKEMEEPDDGIYDWQLLNKTQGGWQKMASEKRIVRSRKLLLGPPPIRNKDAKKDVPANHRDRLDAPLTKPFSYRSKSAFDKFKSFISCGQW